MELILIIVVLVLLFGGGGYWGRSRGHWWLNALHRSGTSRRRRVHIWQTMSINATALPSCLTQPGSLRFLARGRRVEITKIFNLMQQLMGNPMSEHFA